VAGRAEMNGNRAVEMTRRGKVQKPEFLAALGNPAQTVGFPHFRRPEDELSSLDSEEKQKPSTPAAPFMDAAARVRISSPSLPPRAAFGFQLSAIRLLLSAPQDSTSRGGLQTSSQSHCAVTWP
jgi:hypothetical protein